jgi:alanine racemase
LVFIDVDEPAAAIGSASMACRFGQHAASPGDYDATSGRYVCRTPAHSRPESVILTITLNGAEFPMPERYVYTTRANSASPVIGIDVPTIQQQVKRVRELIPRGVAFAAVLKNGEPVGLLADAMARATQVDYFCVPNMQDGIALREAGVKAPIMVLYLTEPSYAPVLLHYGLEPAAYSLAWVEEANRLLQRANGILQVHLWIDTGLGREGVMPAEALALARAVNQSPKLHLQGIATHFCCNEKEDLAAIGRDDLKNRTALQKVRFDETVAAIHAEGIGLDAIIHAGASEVLRDGVTPVYYDMLRIGIMLFENASPEHRNYTWRTRILQVKTLPAGWCVDYDCGVTVETDTPVGLVTHIPYDDVIYRVRGQRVKTLLDHEDVIVLDLSHLPDVREGEEVDIILPDPNSPLDAPASVPVTLRNGADR